MYDVSAAVMMEVTIQRQSYSRLIELITNRRSSFIKGFISGGGGLRTLLRVKT